MRNTYSDLQPDSRVYVAGHRGLVGSSIVKCLQRKGCRNIVTRSHSELDLTNQNAVNDFFATERPEYVFLAAAKVGGILANNTYPADFIYQNLMIEANIIHASFRYGAKRLLFLGSSCIYPKFAAQPMKESELLQGPLESTNEPYAIAKIAGIKLCESYNRQQGTDFRSVMPTNLFGPKDNFDLENSHVLPAMIRKFHLAKLAMAGNMEAIVKNEQTFGPIPPDIKDALGIGRADKQPPRVILWGTGMAKREFLYVDDLADACVFIMNLPRKSYRDVTNPMLSHINIGTGKEISISELADMVAKVVGFDGEVIFDAAKPDGTPRKLLDVSRLKHLGWVARTPLKEGIKRAYEWFQSV